MSKKIRITISGFIVFWGIFYHSAIFCADNPNAPTSTVKLVFVHHSSGGYWLTDITSDSPSGGPGQSLMGNNYLVSATNYGWGPNSIGDHTLI